jgi:hypothetical protein
MPTHHGVGLDEDDRRAPLPPRLSQRDSEQPVPPPKRRTGAPAFQRAELLAQGEVLEDQGMMSATGQRQRSDEDNEYLQHSAILSPGRGRSNIHPTVLIVARDNVDYLLALFAPWSAAAPFVFGYRAACGAVLQRCDRRRSRVPRRDCQYLSLAPRSVSPEDGIAIVGGGLMGVRRFLVSFRR